MDKSEIVQAIDLLRCRFDGCNLEDIGEHRDAVENAILALNNLLRGNGCSSARSRAYARFLRGKLEAHLGAVILRREELQADAAGRVSAVANIPGFARHSLSV